MQVRCLGCRPPRIIANRPGASPKGVGATPDDGVEGRRPQRASGVGEQRAGRNGMGAAGSASCEGSGHVFKAVNWGHELQSRLV